MLGGCTASGTCCHPSVRQSADGGYPLLHIHQHGIFYILSCLWPSVCLRCYQTLPPFDFSPLLIESKVTYSPKEQGQQYSPSWVFFLLQKEVFQHHHHPRLSMLPLCLFGSLSWRRRKKPCRPSATHPQTVATFFTFSFLRNLSPFSPQLCSPVHLLFFFSLSLARQKDRHHKSILCCVKTRAKQPNTPYSDGSPVA